MKNDFRGLIVGWVEPIYVKLKEVGKLAVRHFKILYQISTNLSISTNVHAGRHISEYMFINLFIFSFFCFYLHL